MLSTIQKCTSFTDGKVYHFMLNTVSFPYCEENNSPANFPHYARLEAVLLQLLLLLPLLLPG